MRERYRTVSLPVATMAALLMATFAGCVPSTDQSGLIRQEDNFAGSVDFSTEKATTFQLQGSEPHLGLYTAQGEVTFQPGEKDGTLLGTGVAVFTNANGEHLVADVTWPLDAEKDGKRAGNLEFHWRDSVEFGDGTVVESSGQFSDPENRPQGLVVIAIIAILIGLLVPAVG